MSDLESAAAEFLALPRIAVVGVSRSAGQPANAIFRKLKEGPRQVFAVNPNAESVEGERAYPSVSAIPDGVGGAVVVTPAAAAAEVVEDCARAGVRQIWLHRSFGEGSVSPAAVARCHELGLRVLAGACPMMFCPPVDFGHRCMRFVARWTGNLPTPE